MDSAPSLFAVERASGPLTVLTVCTGNVCRSPLAEGLLRMVMADLPVTVASAGTDALVGEQMTEQNRIIAAELGVGDGDDHRARQLETEHLREADLVLALTRNHRRAAAELLPRVSRHTFTLREFGRLAEAADLSELQEATGLSPEERMREAIDLVAQLRGSLPPLADPAEEDVVDPFRQSDETYALSAQQIVPAVNSAAKLLRAATVSAA